MKMGMVNKRKKEVRKKKREREVMKRIKVARLFSIFFMT